MTTDYLILLQQIKHKLDKSFALVEASLSDLPDYDRKKAYTAKELEPYDALSDRFIRCVEVFIKYFKTYEYYHEAVVSETFRDGLNKMEKLGLVSNVRLWMRMRDVRNKIVHDYASEQTGSIFDQIMGAFFMELTVSKHQIDQLMIKLTPDVSSRTA
jgi:hypothetical protein